MITVPFGEVFRTKVYPSMVHRSQLLPTDESLEGICLLSTNNVSNC